MWTRLVRKTAGTTPHTASAARFSDMVQPIVELREYELHPQHAGSYIQATAEAVELRKSLVPLRLFSVPDTGSQLLMPTHAYFYGGGHSERDEKRAAMGSNDDWKAYLAECRPFMQRQHSNIFVEAPFVNQTEQVLGLSTTPSDLPGNDCILEFRRYKLKLGYDTVPQFLSFYQEGLPSKLHAEGADPTSSLVSLLYSDVGRLNEVIEIWRHGDGTSAMEKSRLSARTANEWKEAIAAIAPLTLEFTTSIHRPTSFSPLQ